MINNWQPIETAPTDQRVVLFRPDMGRGEARIGIGRWDSDRCAKKPRPYWRSEKAWARVLEDRAHPPTHWMPLPEAPQ